MAAWVQSVYETFVSPHHLSALTRERICLFPPPTGLNRHFHPAADLPSCVPPSVITRLRWYRNINLFPITYAFRPRLRVSTYPGRTNLPQETLDFRRTGFSPVFSLLVPAYSLEHRPAVVSVCLHTYVRRSPTPPRIRRSRTVAASVSCLVPSIIGAEMLDR